MPENVKFFFGIRISKFNEKIRKIDRSPAHRAPPPRNAGVCDLLRSGLFTSVLRFGVAPTVGLARVTAWCQQVEERGWARPSPDLERFEQGGFSAFSASGGSQRAPGPSQNDP